MIVKKNTLVEVDENGKVIRSAEVRFISAFSDDLAGKHVLTAYSNSEEYENFFFDSKNELEIIINTFEPVGNGEAWAGAKNVESFIRFTESFPPTCFEHLNTHIEEGHIFEFTGCKHVVAMQLVRVDKTPLYCPWCGLEHVLSSALYGSEPKRFNEVA